MRLIAKVGDRTTQVTVRGKDGRYTVAVGGSTLEVDLVEIGDHLASLLIDGRSHDLGIEKRPEGYRVHGRRGTVTVALSEASQS